MRITTKTLATGLVTLVAALAPATSRADFSLYGTTLVSQQLFTADTTTGAGTPVGPLAGSPTPFGMASYNNQLYTFDASTGSILRINPANGAVTQTIATSTGPLAGQGGFAIRADGVAFVSSALDPSTFAPVNDLFQVNLATGATSSPLHTAFALEALAFGANNTLYALDRGTNNLNSVTNLYRVDTTLGAMTLVGSTGIQVGSPTGALAFDTSTGRLVASLDDALYNINLATGAATAIGTSDPTVGTGLGSISGLAFINSSAVPEPSSALLAGLGLTAVCGLAARHANRPGRPS